MKINLKYPATKPKKNKTTHYNGSLKKAKGYDKIREVFNITNALVFVMKGALASRRYFT